ncbi:MAG: nucleotidyltransferase family protein [Candidatus Jettenia sp.]|nr:nucleotidyltransferase family protein [Candidatus Jettenia sp.]
MYYFEILEGLYKSKIRYLIVGGLSVNLYGVPRVTQDIDIIIAMNKENILKVTSLLKESGYVPRQTVNPDDLANPDKVKDWIENKNLKAFSFYHKKDNYKVVEIVLVHPLDFEKSFINRTVKRAKDIDIYLASVDDIIKMKEFSGRTQDVSDIEMLKKVRKYMGEKNG